MQNSDKESFLGNRRGSQIVEATIVLPITILIMAALICLLIRFYSDFMNQAENHLQTYHSFYETKETVILRMRDTFLPGSGEVEAE